MTLYTSYVVYPDGDTQEIGHDLRINDLTDLNGNPLPGPPPTRNMIVYRVWKKSTKESLGEVETFFYLELVPVTEY